MYELKIGLENKQLYQGCKVGRFENRLRLDTSVDSACVIVAENLRAIISTVPEKDRDLLVITGVPPQQQVLITIVANAVPFFKVVEHYDGRWGVRTKIPTP